MDTCPKNNEKFVEYDKCVALIADLHHKLNRLGYSEDKIQSESERLVESFKKLIDPYQEQPELLDPYLTDLIQQLTLGLQDSSHKGYHTIFKFLYQLIKVVGFKSISKKFPHETDKLPLLVELLDKQDVKDKLNWQSRFVLTVWMSIVILTPFDLVKFDSTTTGPSISEKIYSILLTSLKLHDSCQHVTAYCLAKFFSRPDILSPTNGLADKFISDGLNQLANVKTGIANSLDDVELIGYLKTMAYMYKFLPRNEMKLRCERILDALTKVKIEVINRVSVNHLIIKLIQRAGLTLLPKRVATWRYKRGYRILGQPGSSSNGQSNGPANEQTAEEAPEWADNEEEVISSEYLEAILSILFVAAQDAQTKIRWSAAKGIARMGSRLNRERASDVIDMIMGNFFNDTSSEFSWHGGCLTLAEMSRNGLLLEEKLPQLTRIVSDAIIYDKIKGSFPVGAHVREAACYVCWAMARTYEDHLLKPYISAISINLLCTILFDRDLQCRRAASATLQELVGRQGTFDQEDITILTNADYQNVGQRTYAYLSLAPQIASCGEKYSKPFVEHLIEKKIGHYDIQVRRLAGDSLALMLHHDHKYIRSMILPRLIEMSEQNTDNNIKHGAILSLAKVIKGLALEHHSTIPFEFDKNLIEFVGDVAKNCEKQLKNKTQAPNFIEAIGYIILSAEAASFEYDEDSSTLKQWESIVLQALDSDNPILRDICSDALISLYKTYYRKNKTHQDRLLTILNKSLTSLNESSRCGGLRALSKLSAIENSKLSLNQQDQDGRINTDAETLDIILMSLTSYIAKETRENLPDGSSIVFDKAKAEACEAFVNLVRSTEKSRFIVSLNLILAGYEALLEKAEDYTFDKRGDIGVVVRRAAIKALQDLTIYLLSVGLTSIFVSFKADDKYNDDDDHTDVICTNRTSNLVTKLMGRVLQQAVSYNNSARELAANAVYQLIGSKLPDTSIPHKSEILQLFDKYKVDESFNWRDDSTPIFVQLLSKQEYSLDLWTGLLPSVGQVSDICAKQFRDALSNYIISLEDSPCERNFVFDSFLDTLERNDMADRLLTSGLIVADYLLTEGLLNETSVEFQERLWKICWQSRICKSPSNGNGITSVAGGPIAASDPKRLLSVSRVLSSMLQFAGQVQQNSLKCCLVLLANGYAKVRAYTAEQLYQSIMTYQVDLEENLTLDDQLDESQAAQLDHKGHEQEGSETRTKAGAGDREETSESKNELNLTGAMDLLSQTNWSEPLEKLRPIRDQICHYLTVRPSSLQALTSAGGGALQRSSAK